jgi:DNA-binding response OmpR family regulator
MTAPAKIRRRVLVVDDDRALNVGLVGLLKTSGHAAAGVYDGESAVKRLDRESFDLVVLDLGLPKVDGLDVLKHLRKNQPSLKIIIMTADDTPETVLRVVKEQAYQFISKPMPPKLIIETVEQALSGSDLLPIEVVSAKPDWLELVVPCQTEIADRIESFVQGLTVKLSEEVRESVGRAFRELLMNAIEWGGQLDVSRKVRIACLRTDKMLLYRIQDPGPGFKPDRLSHAAISNDPDQPFAHMEARSEKGLRPGGFGLLMTRSFVDALIYNESHNEVVFIKYLD